MESRTVMKIAVYSVPVFLIGFVLQGQDKFGYVLGILVATALYLFVDWLTEPTNYNRFNRTPGVIRSLPPGTQLYSPMNHVTYMTEKEIEAIGRLLTFADLVSEQGHRNNGMISVSVLTWDDMTLDYRLALSRFSEGGVPISEALKHK